MACGNGQVLEQTAGGPPLGKLKKMELYERAKKAGIPGRSKMRKEELVQAVRAHYKKVGESIRKRAKK